MPAKVFYRVPFVKLGFVPLPEETKSYGPVGHQALSNEVRDAAENILTGFHFTKEEYMLNGTGFQMWGHHTYTKSSDDEFGLSVVFRNSYDKSLSVAMSIGVVDMSTNNLMINGDLIFFRKHTNKIHEDLVPLIRRVIKTQKDNYNKSFETIDTLKNTDLCDDEAYKLMGLLYGHKVLTPTQLVVVRKEWEGTRIEQFKTRNLWSFYNACTYALRGCTPKTIMEKHAMLHKIITTFVMEYI